MASLDALPPTDDDAGGYVTASLITYWVFFVTNTVTHFTLAYIMVFHTPEERRVLRRYLLATTVFDYLATIDNMFLQPRLASGKSDNVPVICYGFCKWFDPRVCFGFYMLWQTLSLAVGASMNYTLFFKWYRFKTNEELRGRHLLLSILFFFGHCLVSLVCGTIIVVRNALEDNITAPQGFDFDRASLEIGQMTLLRTPNMINLVMMALGIYIYPILGVCFSWHLNKILDGGISEQSPKLRKAAKKAVKGIRIQLIGHFLCYVPLFSIYIYSNLTKTEILFQQFFLALSPNLAATFDPLLNLYYIGPYKKKMCSLLRIKQKVSPTGDQSAAETG